MVEVSGLFTLLLYRNKSFSPFIRASLPLPLSLTLFRCLSHTYTIFRSGWNYGKALGAPTGPATFSHPGSATWVRHFGKGVQARYDLATSKGKVIYA